MLGMSSDVKTDVSKVRGDVQCSINIIAYIPESELLIKKLKSLVLIKKYKKGQKNLTVTNIQIYSAHIGVRTVHTNCKSYNYKEYKYGKLIKMKLVKKEGNK